MACDAVVGVSRIVFGPCVSPVGGLAVDQQAALLARPPLPGGGSGEVHLRKRGVPARQHRGSSPVRSTSGLTTSVAWTVRGENRFLYRRTGLGCRVRGALARRSRARSGASGLGHSPAPACRLRRGGDRVPRLAGLGAPCWRRRPRRRSSAWDWGPAVARTSSPRPWPRASPRRSRYSPSRWPPPRRALARPPRRRRSVTVPAGWCRRTADLLQAPVEVTSTPTPPRSGWPRSPGWAPGSAARWLRRSARLRWTGSPSRRSPPSRQQNASPS